MFVEKSVFVVFISIVYYSEIENRVLFSEKCIVCCVTTGVISGSDFFSCVRLKQVALLLQSNPPMAAAVGQHQHPRKFCLRRQEATVFQPAHDTGSSHRFKLVSVLGETLLSLAPLLLRGSILVFARRLPGAEFLHIIA